MDGGVHGIAESDTTERLDFHFKSSKRPRCHTLFLEERALRSPSGRRLAVPTSSLGSSGSLLGMQVSGPMLAAGLPFPGFLPGLSPYSQRQHQERHF